MPEEQEASWLTKVFSAPVKAGQAAVDAIIEVERQRRIAEVKRKWIIIGLAIVAIPIILKLLKK